jgi:Bacterial protein of unknown function (DUF899)
VPYSREHDNEIRRVDSQETASGEAPQFWSRPPAATTTSGRAAASHAAPMTPPVDKGRTSAATPNVAVVAKTTLPRLSTFSREHGWRRLRLLSSAGNSYNRDYLGEDAERWQMPMLNVFHQDAEMIRHFWGAELTYAPPDPGQDHRSVGTLEPLLGGRWGPDGPPPPCGRMKGLDEHPDAGSFYRSFRAKHLKCTELPNLRRQVLIASAANDHWTKPPRRVGKGERSCSKRTLRVVDARRRCEEGLGSSRSSAGRWRRSPWGASASYRRQRNRNQR